MTDEKPTTWAVVDDPLVHEQVPILGVPPGFPLDGMVPRVRVSAAEWEAGASDKPQVVLVSDTTDVTYASLARRELVTHLGRAVVLEVETVDRRMEVARDALARLEAETQEAVHPRPKNRHERRAAAAKARKGGW